MKEIYESCLTVLLSICLAFTWNLPAFGAGADTQIREPCMDRDEIGKYAEEMTGRIPEYEICGEELIRLLADDVRPGEMRNTGIIFDTADEAVSFGRYFYRYVYLGKERIQLASGKTGESSCVYVQCDNPVKAAKQHRQVEARLWETAAAAAEMEEQEKALFFYEWVYDHVEYDTELRKKTVYDAVMEGSSVCWGYVSAYLTLCRMSGLNCEPVYSGDHAWNRVWIEGRWNYCDITWDKGQGERRRKLMSEEEMEADPAHRRSG